MDEYLYAAQYDTLIAHIDYSWLFIFNAHYMYMVYECGYIWKRYSCL